jgi:integrase
MCIRVFPLINLGGNMGKDLKGKELGVGISQRKDGRYTAKYTDRFGRRVSVYADTERNIKRVLSEAIYADDVGLSERKSIKLNKWYDKWMSLYKEDVVRPDTKIVYRHIYNKYVSPYIGSMYVKDIKQMDVHKVIKRARNDGVGYETQNKIRIILQDIFNKAIDNEYIYKNPVRGISIKYNEKKDVRVLSEEEQVSFFNCSKGTFYDNFFVVAVTTGMRLGELAALRWKDVDIEKNVIHVCRTLVYQKYDEDDKKTFHFEDPKTFTSKRDIPINKQCEVALKKQYLQKKVVTLKAPRTKKVEKQFQDLLFTTKYNTPLNSSIMSDAIKRIVNEVNLTRDVIEEIEPFSCHCFRHTFATRCFEAGIKPKIVQAYLGHATLQMTMDLYTKVFPKHMSSEMEKLEQTLECIEDSYDAGFDKYFDKAVGDE